jgi:cell division protein FtsW (lipid II flippase)
LPLPGTDGARGLIIAAAGAQPCSCACWPAPLTLIFFTYAFVNMGMVSGILPVVGVPLPFMSATAAPRWSRWAWRWAC